MTQFGASKAANALAVELKSEERESTIDSRPELALSAKRPGVMPSQDALQAAARLRVLLGATGKVVAVSGIAENDGSTELASSLGSGLAAITESPVLIIDANSADPGLHELYGIARRPGLLNVLDNNADLAACVHRLELSNLFVLPLGESRTGLAALLSKPETQEVLEEMREKYRYIVVDMGLVAAGAEGVLLASMSDGVVAAVASGVRRRHEVQQFQQELKRLRIPLLGVVLTKEA